MNEACRHWHAVYSAALIVIEISTAAPMGATASMPTATQTMLANSKFRLEEPGKFTGD